MFTKETADGRAQVGIGTLIVFIAMVLVAAIAAGVLINTAGFLQTQAEATGEESTDLVSERIDVTSEVGIVENVSENPQNLSEIRVGVTGAAGSSDIDLNETIVQAVGPYGQEILTMSDEDDWEFNETSGAIVNADEDELALDDNEFGVVDQDNDPVSQEEAVLDDTNGDLTLVFNPAAAPFGDGEAEFDEDDPGFEGGEVMGTSDTATLDIVSPSGATTQSELRAPSLFGEGGEAVRL